MNDNVVGFPERKDPHWTGRVRCMQCQHEWQGVVLLGISLLECPSCGCEKGVPKFPYVRSDYLWRCNCGNDLMLVTAKGAYCPHCNEDVDPA